VSSSVYLKNNKNNRNCSRHQLSKTGNQSIIFIISIIFWIR
jgi:hypothetical protein